MAHRKFVIIVTVLITVTFKIFPSLWLTLEIKVAKIPIEVRFLKSLASNIVRMIGITLIEQLWPLLMLILIVKY